MASKKELRQQFMALRNATPEVERQRASLAVCEAIALFCQERGITRIGAFWSFGSEIDLRSFIQGHSEWQFFLPRVMSHKPPRLAWGAEPLEPGVWGIMEPVLAPHATPPVQLLLVPGLAFDAQGYRLGYGGGFYDATLAGLERDVITLAVGFELQRCETLPRDTRDIAVQALMTEAGVTWF